MNFLFLKEFFKEKNLNYKIFLSNSQDTFYLTTKQCKINFIETIEKSSINNFNKTNRLVTFNSHNYDYLDTKCYYNDRTEFENYYLYTVCYLLTII